jgi:hypothetical protein
MGRGLFRYTLVMLLAAAGIIYSPLILAQDSCPRPECDPVSTAVAAKVSAYMGYNQDVDGDGNLDVWIHNRYGPDGAAFYKSHLQHLDKLAAWVRTLPPGRIKYAYEGMVDTYRSEAQEALNEVHTHAKQKEMIAFEKHQKECEQKARQYKDTHKIPTPPE